MHVLIVMPLLILEPSVNPFLGNMESVLHLGFAFMKGNHHSLYTLMHNPFHMRIHSCEKKREWSWVEFTRALRYELNVLT